MAQEPVRLTVGSSFLQECQLYVQRQFWSLAPATIPLWAKGQGARDNRERPVMRIVWAPAGAARRLLLRHQLDATILRASFGCVVGRYEIGLAVAVRMQPAF